MNILESHIRSLTPLTAGDMAVIQQRFKPVTLEKGDYLSRRGRDCDTLAFIVSGYVRVFVEADDREVTQWISSPGYFVTDLSSFIFQTPGRWNIQALTPCDVLHITRDQYQELRSLLPAWRELDRIFIVKCFTMLEDRIFNHLYMSSEDRFHHLMTTQPELFNLVPLQYLASMLGMTPETLSRLRRKASES